MAEASRRRRGLQVCDLAKMAGVDRETMARALEHHGYLKLVAYDPPKRRRMVAPEAEAAGIGWNIDPALSRPARRHGHARAAAFPVFDPEQASSILWTLDLDGIRAGVAARATKRERLRWLMQHHAYLPSGFIAGLAGSTTRAVEKARSRARIADLATETTESSVVGYEYLRGV